MCFFLRMFVDILLKGFFVMVCLKKCFQQLIEEIDCILWGLVEQVFVMEVVVFVVEIGDEWLEYEVWMWQMVFVNMNGVIDVMFNLFVWCLVYYDVDLQCFFVDFDNGGVDLMWQFKWMVVFLWFFLVFLQEQIVVVFDDMELYYCVVGLGVSGVLIVWFEDVWDVGCFDDVECF